MPLYRDEAVVLRTHKLGEADRIITLLTRQHGIVRAVAKGVRRTTSRWGSRVEPFNRVDLQFSEGRNLDTITQAETLDPFHSRLGMDYERYTAGTAMLETAQRLVPEEKQPALQQYLLLVGALRSLSSGQHTASAIMDSYMLRALSVAGYAPSFDHCVGCGEEGPHRFFNPAAGGVMCVVCKLPGSAVPGHGTVDLLSALVTGDWDQVAGAEAKCRREASGLVGAYLSWHLERGLRSMEYVER